MAPGVHLQFEPGGGVPAPAVQFVQLHHVTGTGLTTVILHDRSGGSADIIGTYPDDFTPAQSLDAFLGQGADGRWILTVEDAVENSNAGTLREWGVDLWCAAP